MWASQHLGYFLSMALLVAICQMKVTTSVMNVISAGDFKLKSYAVVNEAFFKIYLFSLQKMYIDINVWI